MNKHCFMLLKIPNRYKQAFGIQVHKRICHGASKQLEINFTSFHH